MKILKTLSYSLCMSALLPASIALAEPQKIEISEQNWALIADASIVQIDGRNAIKLGNKAANKPFSFAAAALKGIAFENGTIEYEVKLKETRTFSGLRFRSVSQGDFEEFYLRAHQSGNPDANQYMPSYNGIASWQLYAGPSYATPTKYKFDEWMKIKIVVQGDLADFYIDDVEKPALSVNLKRDPVMGGVVLWGLDIGGPSWVSNLTIDTKSNEKIIGTPVPEKEAAPGTIMEWKVSDTIDSKELAGKATLDASSFKELNFTKMSAQSTGLLDLSQLQGVKEGADTALVKIIIESDSDQIKAFEYGFSDDATVYLNGQAIASGSDRYRSRDYRFLGTIGYYDTAWLPLKKGKNLLVIAVTESTMLATGWGVQGRFKNMDGITVGTKW